MRVYLSEDDSYHFPVTLDEISPHLVAATLSYEDHYFYSHPGINPISLIRAGWLNLKAGKVLSGGSTISQQVARMLENRPRNLPSKLIEALHAFQLEARYSKDEILEAYLNRAPYGGNIVGVGASSRIYFDKHVSVLGPGEAALLASLPKSPESRRPDRHHKVAVHSRDEVLRRMLKRSEISEAQYLSAIQEDVPNSLLEFSLYAPHLCDLLKQSADDSTATIRSTVDLDMQQTATRLLQQHVQSYNPQGIRNGCVVIIENQTAAVRSLVGSADYFDRDDGGQVNGAYALRSPGSTLKPFVYALAMDRGLITPTSLLEDIPINYSGYEPTNFDEKFHGAVTVKNALIHSMNVPAVILTNRVGLENFLYFLQKGGISSIYGNEESLNLGLSTVLGGVGIRLIELTNLYATLGRMGAYKPFRLMESEESARETQILSEGASWLTTGILTELQRQDFPQNWQSTAHLPSIAWKTGTSYGYHDAWSIGYTPEYTIGVWVGNFSGEGNPKLIGAEAAGPLLFQLFSVIAEENSDWFAEPDEIDTRTTCTISGMPANPWCVSTVQTAYIRGVSPEKTCDLHVQLLIDKETNTQLCPQCRAVRDGEVKTFVQWTQTIATWRKRNGFPVSELPAHFRSCKSVLAQHAPQIHSPAEDCSYFLRDHVPLHDQQILLEASVAPEVKVVYWFVDGKLIANTGAGEAVFYPPERGHHEVVCMDDEGRQATRRLIIE